MVHDPLRTIGAGEGILCRSQLARLYSSLLNDESASKFAQSTEHDITSTVSINLFQCRRFGFKQLRYNLKLSRELGYLGNFPGFSYNPGQ